MIYTYDNKKRTWVRWTVEQIAEAIKGAQKERRDGR